MKEPTPNNDESIAGFIGNFHKSIPHVATGEVDPSSYITFKDICDKVESGLPLDFTGVPPGTYTGITTAKFTSPLAGAATESFGPDPKCLEMGPAPGIRSASTAAEMVELYWMALLRDVPLAEYETRPEVADAIAEIRQAFTDALAEDNSTGALRLAPNAPADLPADSAGGLDIRLQTLFRCGLPGEDQGPLISQFFLRDIPFGVQIISPRQRPYRMGRDYLTNYQDWYLAQHTGKDKHNRDYSNCNFFGDDPGYYAQPRRYISTLRDLARFVNRDALHQAYFNAALFLDSIGAPLDPLNPYESVLTREGGFATLGGPDLLTMVSEVASRALKVVWRQKWLVHRRCRPEVYGGLLQMQMEGIPSSSISPKDYELHGIATNSEVADKIKKKFGGYFLPLAYSAGSPNHPAYGAGHATVAGACVTILKAWFKEDAFLDELITNRPLKEPEEMHDMLGEIRGLVQPGEFMSSDPITGEEHFEKPADYSGDKLTIGGELNKLASNVAMGRSMGGVHWRSDNTRSLRLGEQVAIEILLKRISEYAEPNPAFSFQAFDGNTVTIDGDGVHGTTRWLNC